MEHLFRRAWGGACTVYLVSFAMIMFITGCGGATHTGNTTPTISPVHGLTPNPTFIAVVSQCVMGWHLPSSFPRDQETIIFYASVSKVYQYPPESGNYLIQAGIPHGFIAGNSTTAITVNKSANIVIDRHNSTADAIQPNDLVLVTATVNKAELDSPHIGIFTATNVVVTHSIPVPDGCWRTVVFIDPQARPADTSGLITFWRASAGDGTSPLSFNPGDIGVTDINNQPIDIEAMVEFSKTPPYTVEAFTASKLD